MNIITLLSKQFFSALAIGLSVGAIAGYIGSLMITKRMALMAGALGHLALPGVALGLLFKFDVSLGSLAFLTVGIFIIWILEKYTKIPFEATTAVVFTTSLAIAFLFLPHKETNIALMGDISNITPTIAAIFVLISATVFTIIWLAYKKIVLIGISEDLARIEGINTSAYNLVFLACIALVVALGVRIIGGLMTAALVAIPAATSRNISRSLTQYATLSCALGAIACTLGIVITQLTKLPVGPMIIICSATFFGISLIISHRRS